jgi:hypothetical protein
MDDRWSHAKLADENMYSTFEECKKAFDDKKEYLDWIAKVPSGTPNDIERAIHFCFVGYQPVVVMVDE